MDTNKRLRQFIEKHRVVWEAQPLNAIHNGLRLQVGFEAELRASHRASERPTPDCPRCHRLFGGLTELAASVLQHEDRCCRYDIGPFDHALHFDSARTAGPEVILKIRILHRHDYFQPVDVSQRECLAEIEESLRLLGVRRS